MKKKGFTLIELLAVLVLLAIIALITIPIVIRTINNSEEEAEKKSILGYARVIENDIANFMIETPGTSYDKYNENIHLDNDKNRLKSLNYKGNDIECDDYNVSSDGKLKLTCCKVVGGTGIGYNYEKGKVEESKDTSCNAPKEEKNNTYEEYKVGDLIALKTNQNERYYVMYDSPINQDYVVAIKSEVLTAEEVDKNKIGLDGQNHVNRYAYYPSGEVFNQNGSGALAYYSSPSCGYSIPNDWSTYTSYGCKNEDVTNYNNSDVKFVVDKWVSTVFKKNELKEVENYKVRLIKLDDLEALGYDINNPVWISKDNNWYYYSLSENVPKWFYNVNHSYWTMIPFSDDKVLDVATNGIIDGINTYVHDEQNYTIRPVINVYKSKITKITE